MNCSLVLRSGPWVALLVFLQAFVGCRRSARTDGPSEPTHPGGSPATSPAEANSSPWPHGCHESDPAPCNRVVFPPCFYSACVAKSGEACAKEGDECGYEVGDKMFCKGGVWKMERYMFNYIPHECMCLCRHYEPGEPVPPATVLPPYRGWVPPTSHTPSGN